MSDELTSRLPQFDDDSDASSDLEVMSDDEPEPPKKKACVSPVPLSSTSLTSRTCRPAKKTVAVKKPAAPKAKAPARKAAAKAATQLELVSSGDDSSADDAPPAKKKR